MTKSINNRLLRFIPFRRQDIVEMCIAENKLEEKEALFKELSSMLGSIYHFEFHQLSEELKTHYYTFDPDIDTKVIAHVDTTHTLSKFESALSKLLEKANYEALTQRDLNQALNESSLFKIKLEVNFNDFDEVLIYCRGEYECEESINRFFNWFPKSISFTNYDRVVIFLKFKDELSDETESLGTCKAGSTMLKLFQNVPKADLEMLFPNTQVRMRLIDKLLIGIPALISGGAVLTTKLSASILLLGSLIGFWLGFHNEPVALNQATMLILAAGAGALGGYLWKQFNNFKNRKLRFMQSLTQNLYFKNLDNNAGVIFRLINDAEEEECKEALLAYYFLLVSEKPLTMNQIDEQIEYWLKESWHAEIDFEVEDAIGKLETLNIIEKLGDQYRPLPLEDALTILDKKWDDYFVY